MDIDKALTEIDASTAEAEEFHLCVDKLHEIIADYCSRSH